MRLSKKKRNVVNEHSQTVYAFTFLGGIAFILWSVIATNLEQVHYEIWPLRIGCGLAFILTGPLLIKRGASLSIVEWWIASWGLLSSAYVYYVSFEHGLHPAWITGCTLVIIGVLNYLTYLPQTITFAAGSFLLSLITFYAPPGTANTNPWTVVLNFGTAVFLGSLASQLRNNSLRRLIQMESNEEIIWTTLHDGIIMHDSDGKILAINPSAPKILGLSEEQIMGRSNDDPIWKTYHIDGRPCPPEEHPSAVAQSSGKTITDFPLKLLKQDGSATWISITAVPRFEPESKTPTAVVVSLRDITAQTEQNNIIQKQKQSLEIAGRLSSLGEMAAGIAHEINTPLAVITLRSESVKKMLKENPLRTAEIGSSIEIILRTTFKIAKIVKSMRTLSRQNDQDAFALQDMQTIISDVMSVSQDRIRNKGIALTVEAIPQVSVECQPGQIGQALLNLLNNSIDAISELESPWIKISFSADEQNFSISVTDSGLGIPKDLREKILQPFFTTKEIGKGTGLGLSLVRSIAEHHHGHMMIDENSGNTCFRIVIPLSQSNFISKAA